jgi:hypothetical protein
MRLLKIYKKRKLITKKRVSQVTNLHLIGSPFYFFLINYKHINTQIYKYTIGLVK